ncbi:N-acetylmuramoyl-L-alanine amidase-like domain-containing protein [Pseudanabaena sp. 'Roaring Creek']|uniref:N-acetylmuramoyl-L-alanine amidase-like domain-containing protein n=1 Tax=Pseudanabaena sp. 'Roaring Creek' TaxID=1681830 RepID=UPI0009E9F0C0|nr:N-acetylmuramoyl-L-alanine amidase-like domain-containing protein [Pseudanabaena sp. 'Roaring Creek']
MSKAIKPFLLCTLLGISFSDYFIPEFKNCDRNDRVIVTAKSNPSTLQSPASSVSASLDVLDDPTTKTEYQQLMQSFGDRISQLPMNEVLQTVSSQFLGKPYREGLLDRGEIEKLSVSLTEFDCVLFVETVLAFTRNLLATKPTYANFIEQVQTVRYANGNLDGYCSRLHYFSAWIRDNQKRNIVRDLTAELGGIRLEKRLNFMSSNWQKYPRLKHSESNYQCILAMEEKLELETKSAPLRYIPSPNIHAIYSSLKAGDIIAVVTDIKGLDTTHTGFVYPTAKGFGFIHASPSGKVKVSPDLQRYVERVDHAIGIMVARPQP